VASVRILLTFDDGPHGGALGASNRTEKVLDALRDREATAAFFIQTHVPYRLASPAGRSMAARAHAEGHVLAIPPGGFADHRCHKWRCTQPADTVGAVNGLDADMMRARAAIREIARADPQFVRATYGYTDDNCMNVYRKNELTHVYWDIVGDDSAPATRDSIAAALHAETQRLAAGGVDLIYLMHDINQVTAEHLAELIDVIAASARTNDLVPEFACNRTQAEAIMRRKSRPGTDNPCPADSMG
jgi:peptidoglycan/xylan/chitin deacetylase (PgdA/CDA1 family)